MRKFKEIFYKKSNQCELRFFTLSNLNNTKNLNKFISIIDIFELKTTDLIGFCFAPHEADFSEQLFNIDKSIVYGRIISKATGATSGDTRIQFNGTQIGKVIELLSRNDIPLYIIPTDNIDGISKIEIVAHDREYSSISFSEDVYNHDEIISKINDILR